MTVDKAKFKLFEYFKQIFGFGSYQCSELLGCNTFNTVNKTDFRYHGGTCLNDYIVGHHWLIRRRTLVKLYNVVANIE